jgi:hypothetical protein
MDFTKTDKPISQLRDPALRNPEREHLGHLGTREWLGIACILTLFVIGVIRLHPINFFGLSEDDSIYFSSAKALASGKGYILPSVPGTPAATKYPIFYPWILSWIWRWNPSFPANLSDAIAVSVAFGMAYIGVAFLFLRRMRGITKAEALGLTAYCALHPLVVYFSGNVVSDIPFAALSLAAMLSAESAVDRDASIGTTARCGLITGLSMLMRVFGVPIAAGILAAMIVRRAWRQFLIFSVCIAPFFAVVAWRAVFPTSVDLPVGPDSAASFGWTHTWTYYASYLTAWKVAVPTTHVLVAMLKNNALTLLCQPAYYLLYPYFVHDTVAGRALVAVVAAAMLGGIVRQALRHGWKAVHFVLPAYVAVIVFWNYPLADRFLIPFLPLFAAGIWLELKNVLRLVRVTMLSDRPRHEKAVAVSLCLVIVGFGCAVLINYAGGMRSLLAEKSRERADISEEKQAAYQWLSRSTATKARVIAYEDASVYLYAGRVAIRPMMFTTEVFYEPSRLEEHLEHMTDVPRAIHADYWIFADDDYAAEWKDARAGARVQMEKIESALPLVYQSRNGHARVRYLGCIQYPENPSCRSADRVLFPTGYASNSLAASTR